MGELAERQEQPLAKSLTAREIRAQVNLIQEVLRDVMKKGTHYDVIQGTQGPTLLKPGAEKIMMTFRLAADPVVEDLSGEDERRYRVTVRLTAPDGRFVGSGVGECSTSEEKYRWRSAVCDEEYEATPEDRRRVKWRQGRQGPYSIKQVRTEPADLANTVLKMAKKRAQVDAVITATAASDIFTQDLEDLPEEYVAEQENGNGAPRPRRQQPRARTVNGDAPVTEGQVRMIHARLRDADTGITSTEVCEHFGAESIEALKKAQVNDVLAFIQNGPGA